MNALKKLCFCAIIISYFIACVPPDPNAVYGWTANGSQSNPGTNITGPRILDKIIMNGLLFEEYTSTSGVVSKMEQYVYSNSTISEKHLYTVTYNGTKISEFKMVGTKPNSNEVGTEIILPTYNNSNKIISFVKDFSVNTNQAKKRTQGNITYDTSNRITKIAMLTGVDMLGGTNYLYNNQEDLLLTYTGNNVSKIDHIIKLIDPSNGQVLNTNTFTYEFSNFDNKLNPFSTLSKDFITCISIMAPPDIAKLSENNAGKSKISNAMLPSPIESSLSYQYDQQNYPYSSGGYQFFYKPI